MKRILLSGVCGALFAMSATPVLAEFYDDTTSNISQLGGEPVRIVPHGVKVTDVVDSSISILRNEGYEFVDKKDVEELQRKERAEALAAMPEPKQETKYVWLQAECAKPAKTTHKKKQSKKKKSKPKQKVDKGCSVQS